eukprot:TRINITY_DN2562_c1_g1_i1.p1 TRINITY_DN2562_c1_g1~~TRINITY_DN2562_c1_g1_i1.p1  ORF type:complete len:257 (+),score=101.29 TRINITY_DN2562_c1_g1_i1:57-773(+)
MPSVLLVVSQFTAMPATKAEASKGVTPPQTGWYLPEVAHPYYVFKKAGYEVVFVSPKGGDAACDESSLSAYAEDAESQQFKTEQMHNDGTSLKTVSLAELPKPAAEYSAIFYAGGHGVMWDFPDCEAQNKAAAAIYEKGGVVSAVCHGPAALVNIKLSDGSHLVAGKLVTGFTNTEEDAVQKSEVMPFMLETVLKERGARFVSVKDWGTNTVTDERLVTGQNPQSAGGCAEAVVKALQ